MKLCGEIRAILKSLHSGPDFGSVNVKTALVHPLMQDWEIK
jgi:hypothetical protein